MGEDEGFIRAIVDGPGDDLPRLAYADWLDDRSDPRGPYLRAELEWAKPWRSGERPGDNPELRTMAAGLDPVWVARVSRPPMGVCCDHFEWTTRGAHASDGDVERFEREIGVTLPHAYRAFILNNNGAQFGVSDEHDGGWRFASLEDIRDLHAAVPRRFETPGSSTEAVQWLRRLLWIGQGVEIIHQLMLGISGPLHGMVCVLDSQVQLDTNYDWFLSGISPHSTTFAECLPLVARVCNQP